MRTQDIWSKAGTVFGLCIVAFMAAVLFLDGPVAEMLATAVLRLGVAAIVIGALGAMVFSAFEPAFD